jgi:hypothetical protein
MNATAAQLLEFATTRSANWLLPIISAGVAWLLAQGALHAPILAEPLSQVDTASVSNFITGCIVALLMGYVNAKTNNKFKEGTADLQNTLNRALESIHPGERPLDPDGVPGPRTNSKAREVVTTLIKSVGGQ